MLLVGLSFVKIALGVLYTSITIIVGYILYRRLLAYLNKDVPSTAGYCFLNALEQDPVRGELEFCFSSEESKLITFEILNSVYDPIETIISKEFKPGQHILRFDSTKLPDGVYYYQLKTDNQQTMKKMRVSNHGN